MAFQQFDPQDPNIDPDKLLDADKPHDDSNKTEVVAATNAKTKGLKGKSGGSTPQPYIKPGAIKPPGPRIERPTSVADFKKVSDIVSQMRRVAGQEPDPKKLLFKLGRIADGSGYKLDEWLDPAHWANYRGENQHAMIIKHLSDADMRVRSLQAKAKQLEEHPE